MKNLKALFKLDVLLITPYWKWWVMFFGIALIMGVMNQDGASLVLILAIFAATMTAFPFESTDKSNLNVLFATLPSNRRSMLVARYGFILLILGCMLVVGILTGIILDLIFSNTISFQVIALISSISIGAFLLAVSFQTPFFYWKGYTKGRIFMWIPIIVIVILINLPNLFNLLRLNIDFNIFEIAFRNVTATSLISLGVGLLAFVISFFVSCKVFLKKDI